MAALRPESEESLDNQCNNSVYLEEGRKEDELGGTTEEASESKKGLFQGNGDAEETKESAEALDSSSVRSGFIQNGESNPVRESDSSAPPARAHKPDDVFQDEGFERLWSESEEELDSRTCSLSGGEDTGMYELALLCVSLLD